LSEINGSRLIKSIVIDPAGNIIAVASGDTAIPPTTEGNVGLWFLSDGKAISTLRKVGDYPIQFVSFSDDSKYLIAGSHSTIGLWSVESLMKQGQINEEQNLRTIGLERTYREAKLGKARAEALYAWERALIEIVMETKGANTTVFENILPNASGDFRMAFTIERNDV
jgi:hypothetical protein